MSPKCFEVVIHKKCLHKECIHLLQVPLNTKLTLSDLTIQVSFNTMQTLQFWHKTIYQCKYQSFKYLVHRQQMLSTWSFSLRFHITATVMWKNWQIAINWPFPANILSSKLDSKLREKTCYYLLTMYMKNIAEVQEEFKKALVFSQSEPCNFSCILLTL